MAGRQRIDRARRDYNKWVRDQTLEDYALRFTAKDARLWSAARVGQTAFGAVSFLALEAIGGSITLSGGFANAMAAIAVSVVIIFVTALPICLHAARAGVDIDLLTRGAGFGYIGSTIASLIYASFTFLFFAIESVILAMALELCLGVPLPLGYLVSALAVIPLVTFGISAISRFQVWTQPLFLVLNAVPIIGLVIHRPSLVSEWTRFAGLHSTGSGFDLLGFGAGLSVTIALVVQVGEQVDFLRFLPSTPRKPASRRYSWWAALLVAGPGWVVGAIPKLLAGSFLATALVHAGVPRSLASEPPRMYAFAFKDMLGEETAPLILTLVLVSICQMKINITNAYAGSIAWSNFFSRLTHMHPGRVVWLVFNVLVALLVMQLGVYQAIEQTLAFYSSVAVAWIGALVSDLVINKPLRLSPVGIEFKRAHLYDVNPVGVGAMTAAIILATAAQLDAFGQLAHALSPLLALAASIVIAPVIAWVTNGRFYLARAPCVAHDGDARKTCCICESTFEAEDMAHCPAYDGWICSLCCTLDARCHDLCKPHGRFVEQAAAAIDIALPGTLRRFVEPHFVEYLATFIVLTVLVGGVLALIGLQVATAPHADRGALAAALYKIFAVLVIVIGVASWWLHLNRLSRRRAQEETLRQTDLLMEEITAHQRTDVALKKAKEAAEAANFAKSRYVVGLSHELRTPLNAIMGFAQLLEGEDLEERPRRQITIMRRNAGHLAALIDGLLDISKIEAGKLDLARDRVAIRHLLVQVTEPFALQAASKGIGFSVEIAPSLPSLVASDEKRLSQILMNLLSNAMKFTDKGEIALNVGYRNHVAEFLICDTGPGIGEADRERIFLPFERLNGGSGVTGTGLGLTISRLLANVMGGEISLNSELGHGSTFRLRLFLPQVESEHHDVTLARKPNYGSGHDVLVVDDNVVHRDLIVDALAPAGFSMRMAATAGEALAAAAASPPDVVLLDIEMPDMDGWATAEALRRQGLVDARIVIISASAIEEHRSAINSPFHDAFLMKPIDIERLHGVLAAMVSQDSNVRAPKSPPSPVPALVLDPTSWPATADVERLISLCEIGSVRGLREALDDIAARAPHTLDFVAVQKDRLDALDLRGLMRDLERVSSPAS